MDYLEKNLSVIKDYNNVLYEGVLNYNSSWLESECPVTSVDTKDGNKAIIYMKDNNSIRLNSAYRPLNEAEEWAKQFNFNSVNIVVSMFGLGNGIFARELMKKRKETDLLLIYEPSVNIFLHTLKNYDITDLLQDDRVSISVEGINQKEYSVLISDYVDWTNLVSQIKCIHPQYDRIFTKEYTDFSKIFEDQRIKSIVNKNTEAFWGAIMTCNEIVNFKHIKQCNLMEELIEDIPKDVPAIIVSAGPSLDKNIDDLVKAKGKSIIFAVDSALKYLLQRDIIPDFVVTLDAAKSLKHFSDERFKEIPLFCKSSSNPYLLDLHQGKKIFYSNEIFLKGLFESIGKKQSVFGVGGCVATAAFAICIMLGFRRIIMIGQDLCYQGELTHAGGVINNAYNSGEGAMMMVEDIYGNMVKARYDWYTYLLWFEETIAGCPKVDVIDATEGGAKIKGTQIMALSEAILKYCLKEIDVDTILRNKKPAISKDKLPEVYQYFQEGAADLGLIAEKAQAAIDILEELIPAAQKDRISNNEYQIKLKRLARYNQEIYEMSVYQLLNDFAAKYTTEQTETINQLSDDRIGNQIRTYTKSLEVYKAIHKSALALLPLMEERIQPFQVY
ncbi:MAG: DUF115 domain-containing protein [Mobilitalea sp.]